MYQYPKPVCKPNHLIQKSKTFTQDLNNKYLRTSTIKRLECGALQVPV